MAGQNDDTPEVIENPKTIREILADLKVNPAAEIVALLKMGELQDRDRLKGWESLLKYMEPKQVEIRPSDRWLSEAARKPTGQIIQETIFCDWDSHEPGE